MTQQQLIRSVVVGISARQPRHPWLPASIRRALNAYRLRVVLRAHLMRAHLNT